MSRAISCEWSVHLASFFSSSEIFWFTFYLCYYYYEYYFYAGKL